MAASRICQNIPALQDRLSELQASAAAFVENSTFSGSGCPAPDEDGCKGTAYTDLNDNDARAHESLSAMQAMVDSLKSFVDADIIAFTEADGAYL